MPNFLSVFEIEDHLELLMYLPCANDDAYPAALRQAGFQISSGYDAHLDEEEGRQRVTVSIMHVGDESGVAARSENTTMISGGSPSTTTTALALGWRLHPAIAAGGAASLVGTASPFVA